jgi:hypothetical protein
MIVGRVVAPLVAATFVRSPRTGFAAPTARDDRPRQLAVLDVLDVIAPQDHRAQMPRAERRRCNAFSAARSGSSWHRTRRGNNRTATVRQNNQSRRMAALYHDDAALTEAYGDPCCEPLWRKHKKLRFMPSPQSTIRVYGRATVKMLGQVVLHACIPATRHSA